MALSAKNGALTDQKAALKAKLAEIEKAEKIENEKRMILVGRAVLSHAETDSEFERELSSILDAKLTKKRDRALFGLGDKSLEQQAG